MKKARYILWMLIVVGVAALPLGCGSGNEDHGHKETKSGDHGGHGEESPSGASFKPGKGVIVKPETSKILGLEVAEVTEETLPQIIRLNAQLFSEAHRFEDLNINHTACQFHGSGFLPQEKSGLVKPEQKVKFKTDRGEILDGFVVAVQSPLAHGETEIIVGITTSSDQLNDGEFISATILVPRDERVITIPSSALLRTAEGTYVYAVNGDAYYKTKVKVGSISEDKVEITDGLYAGDQVVIKPVETLWLIELRATKGGGHSH